VNKHYICCQCNALDAIFIDLDTGEFLCKDCWNERKDIKEEEDDDNPREKKVF